LPGDGDTPDRSGVGPFIDGIFKPHSVALARHQNLEINIVFGFQQGKIIIGFSDLKWSDIAPFITLFRDLESFTAYDFKVSLLDHVYVL
jgi:hypothetical protein